MLRAGDIRGVVRIFGDTTLLSGLPFIRGDKTKHYYARIPPASVPFRPISARVRPSFCGIWVVTDVVAGMCPRRPPAFWYAGIDEGLSLLMAVGSPRGVVHSGWRWSGRDPLPPRLPSGPCAEVDRAHLARAVRIAAPRAVECGRWLSPVGSRRLSQMDVLHQLRVCLPLSVHRSDRVVPERTRRRWCARAICSSCLASM